MADTIKITSAAEPIAIPGADTTLWRVRVPLGWLVFSKGRWSGMAYVEDPEHEWQPEDANPIVRHFSRPQ